MPDVVSGQEVPDRGLTDPPRPYLRLRQEEGAWRLEVPPLGSSLLADRGPQTVGGAFGPQGCWPR